MSKCFEGNEAVTKERVGDPQDPRAPFVSHYTEGLNFGYRWNEETGVEPGFAFGSGMSYTSYRYSDFKISKAAGPETGLDILLTVTNTGTMAGDEIVQVYLGEAQVPTYAQSPKKQLAAFLRVEDLQPGESRMVSLHVGQRELSYWDIMQPLQERPDGTKDKWVIARGPRTVMVGSASNCIHYQETVLI